ncbi:MAG: hypothetical protein GX316_09465 [Firmicutes bacterium]|nr:hypothetical protein [Bacillota bacterium]
MRPFAPFVDGYWDVENQLAQHIQRRASAYAGLEHQIKNETTTIEAFEERRQQIKQVFLDGLGDLPPGGTPLNPRNTGVISRNGYIIEKIIFESLPGFFVTGNLYVPNGAEANPAVLFLCGHAREAKAYPRYQSVCIALVKAGFVVFAIDPLGQGERMGYVNPATGKLDVEWGTYEHSHAGMQCTLTGQNIARYFIHDAKRSLDYLCTRREVDSARLGVTGNSGGGTQTSYLMVLDERVKVAIPCTYITAREHYLWTGQAHDAEQNIFGAFTKGLNYDDLLTSIAPRPVQLGAVASDFFTIEGALQSAARAKQVYDLYQCPGNFRLVVADGTHQYADLLRKEAVRWFKYHLMDDKTSEPLVDVIDPSRLEQPWMHLGKSPAPAFEDHELLPEKDLWCTTSGQISLDMPKSKTVFDLNKETWTKTQPKKVKTSDFFQCLQRLITVNRDANPLWVRCIDSGISGNISWQKIFFFTESDILVTGIWAAVDAEAPPWVVMLSEGTNTLEKDREFVRRMTREKGNILLLDVRGHGALKQRKINRYRPLAVYGTEFVLNYNAMMLEDSLLWMRAYDVLEALIYAYGATGKRPSLYGEDWLGVVGLAAAAALEEVDFGKLAQKYKLQESRTMEKGRGLRSLEFRRLLDSVQSIVDERFHLKDHRLEAFNLAQVLDIPRLIEYFGHRVHVHSWVNGLGEEYLPKRTLGR